MHLMPSWLWRTTAGFGPKLRPSCLVLSRLSQVLTWEASQCPMAIAEVARSFEESSQKLGFGLFER